MDPATSFTSLGDPTRLRILRLIRDSEDGRALVGRLAEVLQLRQPTVSHHVKALHDDGIVVREPEGRRVWYSIADEHADRVDALLGGSVEPTALPDLERIARDLTVRFHGVFSPETIHATVLESHQLLASSSQSPMLASRTATFAAARLEALSHPESLTPAVPTVLFVCVENAGRSQIAAGILRQLAGDRVAVRTAGSEPASDVRHSIAAALEEIGVPLGGEFPEAAHRRGGARGGRRRHDGVWRRLPGLPRPPLPRLGTRRPGWQVTSAGSCDQGRHRGPRPRACSVNCSLKVHLDSSINR